MNRRVVVATTMWIWLCGTALLWAEDSVLEQIPDDALAVVVVDDLTDLSTKIEKVSKQIQVPAPPPLLMLKTMTGIQEGMDESGWWRIGGFAGRRNAGGRGAAGAGDRLCQVRRAASSRRCRRRN